MNYAFVHPSIRGHLGRFRILTVVNNTSVNVRAHISFEISVLEFFRVGLLGHRVGLFNLRGHSLLCSLAAAPACSRRAAGRRAPFRPGPHPHLVVLTAWGGVSSCLRSLPASPRRSVPRSIFPCLLAVCALSGETDEFIRSSGFPLSSCVSSLWVADIRPLTVVFFANIHFHSIGHCFVLLVFFFCAEVF